jgi:hypothetical protein
MGVRFECPNGHNLHVKAHLAGKRGLCPECGTKFIVPNFSGGVAADPDAVAATTSSAGGPAHSSGLGGASPEASVSIRLAPPRPATGGATPPSAADDVQWYVRPPTGEQFGPATTALFRQWIAEGRVAADSWVWRTGWADWKAGSESLVHVSEAAAPGPAVTAKAAAKPVVAAKAAANNGPSFAPFSDFEGVDDVLDGDDAILSGDALMDAAQEFTAAETRRADARRRKKRARTLSIALGVAAMMALIVLAVVLSQ